MNNTKRVPGELKRTLGLPALLAVAVGVVVAQVCFVSILQGVGLGGVSFFIAQLVAFGLTICYVLTFSELSLMMPRAGSLSTYTEVAIGHFPAIVATIAGYLAPAIFGLSAELLLVEYILEVLYPGSFAGVGIVILVVLTGLNILGVELFSAAQNILAFVMLTGLLVVGLTGSVNPGTSGGSVADLLEGLSGIDGSILSLTVLALWAFVGLEFVCPLVEESKNPERNIPRAMLWAAFILLTVYFLVALSGFMNLPADELSDSEIPHWLLVDELFGSTGKIIMAVLAITATCSTINTVIATVPRMLFGMAHNRQLPAIFMKVHHRFKTPWFSILCVAFSIGIPLIFLRNAQDVIVTLLISAAAIWLIAYIIAHVDLMVLRRKYPSFPRPFKSPWFPVPQIIGIVGMAYIFLNNAPSPEMTFQVYFNTGIFLLIVSIYAVIWVKFKMKKGLFEPEDIEKALGE